MNETRVDFSYAFGTPHRLTVARPDSSDKTLLDCQAGSLRMAWTYDNLTRTPLAAYATPSTNWEMSLKTEIDGQSVAKSEWTRLEGFLPALDNRYTDGRGALRLQVVGGASAAIIFVEVENWGEQTHQFRLVCSSPAALEAGYNPACMDDHENIDTILAGWKDRSDRVLVLGVGAEEYTMPNWAAIGMTWTLQPGEVRSGWIIRPYRAYKSDLPALRKQDWKKEFDQCLDEWRTLLGRATKVSIPDLGVQNAFYAGLADLFIMREPVADGYVAATAGTEKYRANNASEPGILAIALDQVGLHREAEAGFQMCLDQQGEDGDWCDPSGWSHHWWSCSGFKAWTVMEHYKLTKDRKYLEKNFPRMLAASRFQESQRAKTRKMEGSHRPLTYGLMPKGQADCGLWDDGGYYGVFFPHNIWPVYADACAVEAAKILGRPEVAELEAIHKKASEDLLWSLDHGAIQEDGYRWIPGAPGKTSGSRWGVLNALFPCRTLPADHELISGTIRKIESKMSPGGIPLHTGWMEDGMWVAITLDNLAEVHLVRGNGDPVAEYMYAVLNHGTPLYSWCEERGQEPGTQKCGGDRQHLWTPLAVVRTLRDMLVMEDDDGLNLALGTARSWLASGRPVGIEDAPTYFGHVSYQLQYDPAAAKVTGFVKFPASAGPAWTKLHLRLPKGVKVKSVNPEAQATILPDGAGLYFKSPKGTIKLNLAMMV
jgi:hypothetical protein